MPLRREFSEVLALPFLLMSYFSQGMTVFSQGCFGKLQVSEKKKIALKKQDFFFCYSLTKTLTKQGSKIL